MLKTALFAGFIGIASIAAAAHAGPKYDVKIEQAAKKIVAKKVGDIRGGVFVAVDLPAVEIAPVEIAAADVDSQLNPTKIAYTGPLATPAQPYRSGRPEPVRKVRTITSFVYY